MKSKILKNYVDTWYSENEEPDEYFILNDDKIIPINNLVGGYIQDLRFLDADHEFLLVNYLKIDFLYQVCGILNNQGQEIAMGLYEVELINGKWPKFIVLFDSNKWEHYYADAIMPNTLYYTILDSDGVVLYEPTTHAIEWRAEVGCFFANDQPIQPDASI